MNGRDILYIIEVKGVGTSGVAELSPRRKPKETIPLEESLFEAATFLSFEQDDVGKDRHTSLLMIVGQQIGKEFVLDEGEYRIGRSRSAEVFIDDRSVSRFHAKIASVKGDDGPDFIISDAGANNGVFVNGRKVESALLHDSDKIRLGSVVFKFLIQDELDSRYHSRIHRLINYDSLTGLFTLESFYRELSSELRNCEENSLSLTVMMLDIDGLKNVNDAHGHLVGRNVIREMGKTIRAALRPKDVPAIYGGDEFICYLPGTTRDEGVEVAERLRSMVAGRDFNYRDREVRVTISVGIACYPDDATDIEDLIRAADEAMYKAKKAGRNTVRSKKRVVRRKTSAASGKASGKGVRKPPKKTARKPAKGAGKSKSN